MHKYHKYLNFKQIVFWHENCYGDLAIFSTSFGLFMTQTSLRGIIAGVALLATCASAQANVFSQASFSAGTTFTDGNPGTTMTLAWNGNNYYTSSGGGLNSPYAKYDAAGNFIASASPAPGIDFRSIFTNSANELLARGYASNTIYKQTTFGNFVSYANLLGGSLDAQSAVVLNGAGTEYLAQSGGIVSHWNLSGNYLGSFNLNGFGGAQGAYPQGRGIATAGNDLLTYYNGTLTAWDMTGLNLGSTQLLAGGTSFDSNFSYSYANNKFWVVDSAHNTWRGYDIGLSQNSSQVPEPATLAILGLGLLAMGAARKKKV